MRRSDCCTDHVHAVYQDRTPPGLYHPPAYMSVVVTVGAIAPSPSGVSDAAPHCVMPR